MTDQMGPEELALVLAVESAMAALRGYYQTHGSSGWLTEHADRLEELAIVLRERFEPFPNLKLGHLAPSEN